MITRTDVRQAIQDIREFHSLGRTALHPDGRRRGLTEAQAAKLGIGLQTWISARQLAESFDRGALDKLCALIRTQIDREGTVFGKSAAGLILRVPSAMRTSFLRAVVSHGWSAREIQQEIATRFGTRRSGGRPPALPGGEAGLCQLVEKRAEQWLRLYRLLSRKRATKGVSLQDLAPRVRRALTTAVGDLRRLQRAATARLGELQAGRFERKPLATDR